MIRKWYGSCTEVVRKWYVGASRSQWELVGASDFVSLVLAKNDTFAGILLKPMKYIKLRHCTFRNVVFCYWYNEISTCLNMLVFKRCNLCLGRQVGAYSLINHISAHTINISANKCTRIRNKPIWPDLGRASCNPVPWTTFKQFCLCVGIICMLHAPWLHLIRF